MQTEPMTSDIREAAQHIWEKANAIHATAVVRDCEITHMDIHLIREQAERILAELPTSEEPQQVEMIGGIHTNWPDRNAIRIFIAQQLEIEAATRLNLPLPNRGDDNAVTDQQLDAAWPGLEQTLFTAMAHWEYPDELLDMLENEGRHCAEHVLSQAPAPQRRAMEEAAARALVEQSPTEVTP